MQPSFSDSIIKVIIANDHSIFRKGICTAFQRYRDIEFIGEAGNGRELLDLLETRTPDIILLDIAMPVMNGMEVLPLVREKYPDILIIVLDFISDASVIREMMELGAHCYLTGENGSEKIYETILAVFKNGVYHNEIVEAAFKKKPGEDEKPGYSSNEIRILELLSRRLEMPGIAKDIKLDSRTVKLIIDRLFLKTGSSSVESLLKYARTMRLIGGPQARP